MRTIIAIRHAKSSWASPNLTDQERPLNKRGHNDAPRMAKILKEIEGQVDIFCSSPAKRAHSTAMYFADCYEIAHNEISIEHDLYFKDESDILDLIQNQQDKHQNMMFFSHNPTITGFVNQFTDVYIDNIPTCGISILKAQVNTWQEVNSSTLKLVKSLYPKMIQ